MGLLGSMTGRRKTTIVLVLSVIVISSIFVTDFLLNPNNVQDDLGTLDTNTLAIMDENHIPGVAACAVKDGEVIWTGTYGYANLEQDISVTNDTLFMLGSVSKIMIGIAFTQLCEDELIDLDNTVIHSDYYYGVIVMANLENQNALNLIHNHILNCMRSVDGWSN